MNTAKDFAIFAAKVVAVLVIARQFKMVRDYTGQTAPTPTTAA